MSMTEKRFNVQTESGDVVFRDVGLENAYVSTYGKLVRGGSAPGDLLVDEFTFKDVLDYHGISGDFTDPRVVQIALNLSENCVGKVKTLASIITVRSLGRGNHVILRTQSLTEIPDQILDPYRDWEGPLAIVPSQITQTFRRR